MIRKAFTLVELLVVMVIIVVVFLLISATFSEIKGFKQEINEFTGEVVHKYELESQYRIEFRKTGQKNIEVFENRDDGWMEKYNSTTLNANLLEGHFYQIKTNGVLNEKRNQFPNILSAQEILAPE